MEPLSRTQVLVAIGVTAVVLLLVAKLWLHLSQIAALPVKLLPIAFGQGIGLGLIITATSSLAYQFWGAYRQSADFYLKLVLKPLLLPDLIWLGLLPGLSEEFLFRGVMLPEFGLDLGGVLLSSLCFGAMHLSTLKQWAYVAWAMLIGVLLGLSAKWTGNLLVPIVAHVFTNVLSGVVWKWRERLIGQAH